MSDQGRTHFYTRRRSWYVAAILILALGIVGALVLPLDFREFCEGPSPVRECPVNHDIGLRIMIAVVGASVALGMLLHGRSRERGSNRPTTLTGP